MPIPRSGNIHGVNVVTVNHLLPYILCAAINGWTLAPLLFACVSGFLGPVIPQIADRDDIGEFHVEAAFHMRHSPVEADDGHTNSLHWFCGKLVDRRLTAGTRAGLMEIWTQYPSIGSDRVTFLDGSAAAGDTCEGCSQSSQG